MSRMIYRLMIVSLMLFMGTGCKSKQVLPTASPTKAPTATLETVSLPPSPSPTASIVHKTTPGSPVDSLGQGNDQDSSVTAEQKRAPGGDFYSKGNLERPFNADPMDVYFPEIDIQSMALDEDAEWIYATITFKSPDQNGAFTGVYGLELDVDVDGRGDFLILATNPLAGDWSTDAVQAWTDTNEDVGNQLVPESDPSQTSNGYDALVFDRGLGDDPDIAWSRVSPDDPNSIQIAVKKSLFNDINYLWGVWSGKNLNPAWFDINDHFTFAEAGSPIVDYEIYYPLKLLSEVDNTCRLPAGFEPLGSEPGLCTTASENTHCQPPPQGCQYGWNPQQCRCIAG